MNPLQGKPSIASVRLSELTAYLQRRGWSSVDSPSSPWLVFEGPPDNIGRPLELVLPRNARSPEFGLYAEKAIEALSTIMGEAPELIISEIVFFDRDVLSLRNPETGGYIGSISLSVAATEIQQLKELVAYSTNSETSAKPYFMSATRRARDMVKQFRFGHTFEGSFGFTVESYIVHEQTEWHQPRLPAIEDENEPTPPVLMPLERRVMERIVRGLRVTEEATARQDWQHLVQSYGVGFNANMCSAITKIGPGRYQPVEYEVQWSPKLGVPEDLVNRASFLLNEPSFRNLEFAAKQLRRVKPKRENVRGLVVALSSKGPPLSKSDVERTAVIRWLNRPGGARPVNLIVSLDQADYVAAYHAHIGWDSVEVTGVPIQGPTGWRLAEAAEFQTKTGGKRHRK